VAQGAQTADRAIELLLLAANSEQPMSLTGLGEAAGLNKATTYRLVQSLVERDLLAREADGRRYVVGPGLIALSAMVIRKVNLREVARPVMERICAETNETVSLHIRYLHHRICVDSVESTQAIRRVVPPGWMRPLHTGTASKVILAFLPEPEVAENLARAQAEGIDPKPIPAQLKAVREAGYLSSVGDDGVAGMSVPVFAADGIAAAITVSGPAARFDVEAMDTVAPSVLEAVAGLSATIGYSGDQPGRPLPASA
jgi:DNA-binding IclR family transcriptional regulator